MKRDESLLGNIDWGLFIVFLVMVFMGVANVYSAAFNPKHPDLFDLHATINGIIINNFFIVSI